MTKITLTNAQRQAASALLTACESESAASAALMTAQTTRKDAATALLRAVGWLKADGTLTAKGLKAVEAKQASALARACVPNEWQDPTPLSLPAPVVIFDFPGVGAKHKAATEAGKAAAALLSDPAARQAATPEQLAEAREAAELHARLKSVATVQRALSDALQAAKPQAGGETRTRQSRNAGGSGQTAKDAAALTDNLTAALDVLAKGATPEGMTADQAEKVGKAVKAAHAALAPKAPAKPDAPSAPAPVDHVAAILAMSDADAHAALRKIAAGLRQRAGADAGSIAAVREYLQAHGAPKAASKQTA